MITKFKIFEKKFGVDFRDSYFEKNMWYIDILKDDDDKDIMLKKAKYLINKFKKYDVDYRIYYWFDIKRGSGFYFFLNENNMKKAENIKFMSKKEIKIKKAPDKFEYPDDIEEYIISPKDIELPFMDFFINQRKYNL